MKLFKLKNTETGEVLTMNVDQILAEINRDHSDHFTNYDASDWQEGLIWTELELVGEV